MGSCITGTAYTMKADVYIALINQDAIGKVTKSWIFEKTIDCRARGILRKGVGENSTAFDIENYVNILNSMVKLRSSEVIPSDRRVVNIRNEDGVIYKENQDPSTEGGFQNSTIFEPRGSTPVMNFDGSVIEYETVLMRQEVQVLE
jgi:uncharacterized protein (UPF0248 family)